MHGLLSFITGLTLDCQSHGHLKKQSDPSLFFNAFVHVKAGTSNINNATQPATEVLMCYASSS